MTTSSKNTTKTNRVMHLSKFLSVVKKPELCEYGQWFRKNKKTGKFTGACPIAKAATKRGFKYRGGKADVQIASKFNIPLKEIRVFTHEWDARIVNLKKDHSGSSTPGAKKKALRKVELTPHEMRVAFKESIKSARTGVHTAGLTF